MEYIEEKNQWFGQVPSHWERTRIASVYRIRNTKVSDMDYAPLSVTMKGILPQLETAAKTNAHDDRKLVKKGDFAINSRSDRRGSCGIAPCDGSISLINIVLCPLRNMNPVYYNWLFHTVEFADEFYKWGHGIVDDLWTTTWQEMKNIVIPMPSMEEQKKIADFLDKKCEQIDSIYSDVEAQIEILEQYKCSTISECVNKGLDASATLQKGKVYYMAAFNSKWGVSKIGYECFKLNRNFESTDIALLCSNKGKVVVRPDDMTGKMVSEDNAMQGIKKGDIAIHGMDTWHGAIALSDFDGKITRVVHVCDSKQDKRYIVYYLQHLAFANVYKLISNGVRGNTSDFRSWDKVANIYLPIPPIEEQKEIADYLDKKCAEIESIIADKKKQLEVLENYKKTLIYEYVTGKRRS